MKIHRFLPEPPVQIWWKSQKAKRSWREQIITPLFSTLETFDCWSCYHSFCFPINRTDTFSPLKASPLPGVINLLQLNFCTKHTPVSKRDQNDCGRTQRYEYAWILGGCVNHHRGSWGSLLIHRHSGRQPAFHVCSGSAVVGEITFQSAKNWFVFFKTNDIPIPIKK